MKRTAMVCLLVTLVAATLLAPADASSTSAEKVTRRAVATYDVPTLGSASDTIGAACLPCPSFALSAKDQWVKMEVHDDASPAPAAFDIRQEGPDGRCCEHVAGPFCGSTGKRPVEITPGLDLYVFVFATGDIACPGAFGTSGTAEAVFSNLP